MKDTLRIKIVFGCVLLVASVITWRLFVLSYLRHTLYAKTSQAQTENIGNVLIRGNIFVQDPKASGNAPDQRYLVATIKKFPLAYIMPVAVADPIAALKLADTLHIDLAQLKSTLDSKTSGTKILARRLTPEQVDAVNALNLKGVGIRYEADRFYPGNSFLAKVLGFFGYTADEIGRASCRERV